MPDDLRAEPLALSRSGEKSPHGSRRRPRVNYRLNNDDNNFASGQQSARDFRTNKVGN